jgi:hypothetical protein
MHSIYYAHFGMYLIHVSVLVYRHQRELCEFFENPTNIIIVLCGFNPVAFAM